MQSFLFFSPSVASPATYPVKLPQRLKKDMLPQSVFTIPSELDVSLMLEFVGSVMLICDYTYISDVIQFLELSADFM